MNHIIIVLTNPSVWNNIAIAKWKKKKKYTIFFDGRLFVIWENIITKPTTTMI